MIEDPAIDEAMHSQVPSLGSFINGRPEKILGATKRPNVLVVWLHGDEPLGAEVAHYLYANRPDLAAHIDYLCGNPRAASSVPAKGFCETDLNRSFNPPHEPRSYEEKRAVEILKLTENYDYVLDLHMAVSPDLGDALFIAEGALETPAVRDIIAAAPNRRVIVVHKETVVKSLIGAAANTVTAEYSAAIATKQGVSDVVDLLERLVGQNPPNPKKREIYHIDGTVPKSQDPGPDARNFEFYEPGGYYPILLGTGPRSYREDPTKDYCCFYAKRKEIITL